MIFDLIDIDLQHSSSLVSHWTVDNRGHRTDQCSSGSNCSHTQSSQSPPVLIECWRIFLWSLTDQEDEAEWVGPGSRPLSSVNWCHHHQLQSSTEYFGNFKINFLESSVLWHAWFTSDVYKKWMFGVHHWQTASADAVETSDKDFTCGVKPSTLLTLRLTCAS